MRMSAHLARAIARGDKTSLRVPIDPRLTAVPLRPARRHGGRPFHPHEGDTLRIDGGHYEHVDGREKWVTTNLVYATVNAESRGPLGVLTPDEARQEGYGSVGEFEIAFVERNERAWLNRQVGYLIEQGIDGDDALDTRDAWARVRYEHVWAPREVWVLEIAAAHDLPYLLPGLPEEPEAIPVDRLARRWDRNAAKRYEEAVAEEDRRRSARALARRVRQLKLDGDPLAREIERLLDQQEMAA